MHVPRSAAGVGLLVALLGAAPGLAGCDREPSGGSGGGGRRAAAPPNVLLLSVDTLRADRLGARGPGGAPVMPFLEELAARGLRFTRAYATSSWTAPSLVSLLSGTYPARHGVERTLLLAGKVVAQPVVPPDLPWLPELLARAGYRAFGITANLHAAAEWGFARGFEDYRCLGFAPGEALDEALAGLRGELPADAPWFVWLHWLDPHAPYAARAPWFVPPGGSRRPRLEGVRPARRYTERVKSPADLAYVTRLYDSEVSWTDDALRRAVKALGADHDTLVVVTADHGEEFLEHASFGHGHTLFEETLRVPLVVVLPDGSGAGRRVDEPVSLVDVVPTVLAVAGVDPPDDLPGRSLLDPAPSGARRTLFASLDRDARARAALRGDWKLVEQTRPDARSWLLHVEGAREVPADDPRRRADLAAALAAHLRTRAVPAGTPVPIPPDQLEALRALGYGDAEPQDAPGSE